MNPKAHVLFIGLVIIVILVGEAIAYVPYQSREGSTVTINSYPSTTALVQAVSNGQIDVAPLGNIAPETLAQVKNDSAISIVPVSSFGFTYIGLNLRNSPLNIPIFRKAMLYGFDRDEVVTEALAGYGETLGAGFLSSAYAPLGWVSNSVESYPYSPEKASELLDSIGFTRSTNGVRVDPSSGQSLRTMFIFSKLSDPQAAAAANIFAENMQAIGLPIVSFPETDIDFNSQVKVTYYFDLYIDTVSSSAAPSWLYSLFAGVNDVYPVPYSTNLVGYHNSTFDECAKQLITASDSNSAKSAALSCQAELSLDIPAIPVYSKSLLIAERKGAPNITPITGSIPDTFAASLANVSGLVRIGEVAALTDINPATKLGDADELILRLITDPLLTRGADGSPQPGLADEWQMTDNDTSLTLSLRPNSGFRDGTPTTAHDLSGTLDWLIANMLPSTPLYPVLKRITGISEVNDFTIRVSFNRPDYFAIYEIGNLFALPANLLPSAEGPLSLLLSGALQSSGAFSVFRFIQGSEVDLQSVLSAGMVTGVQGQGAFGATIGGSRIQFTSEQLIYEAQPLENATFTVRIRNGGSQAELEGSYLGLGIYGATLNLNEQEFSLGNHQVSTELYAQLPSGVVIQFGQGTLVVHSPLFMWQVILCCLAVFVIVAGFTFYARARVRVVARAKRRVRRSRRVRVSHPRRKR